MSKSLNGGILTLALVASAMVSSCSQNKPQNQITVVGQDIDSAAIAQDTTTQKAIESSYEFARALSVSQKLAFDVMGYGGPATKGEYAIIKRGADNKPDTVAHGTRTGIIVTAFTTDLNKNSEPEVYIVFQTADSLKKGTVIGYEFDKDGKAKTITTPDYNKAEAGEDYRGGDSIFMDGPMIVRQFPVFNKSGKAGARLKAHYALKNDQLLLNSKEPLKYN